jgi:hypothetical protein
MFVSLYGYNNSIFMHMHANLASKPYIQKVGSLRTVFNFLCDTLALGGELL